MLAWRLHEAKALRDFDPYPMVLRAAAYLICNGPATPQERWEEASGYSPSTLAANIAALTCAASYASERGNHQIAQFIQEYADFLESHVDMWTVTTEGSLVPDVRRHFIRINPADPSNSTVVRIRIEHDLLIRNRAPGQAAEFPAKDIVDAGFLELVRYGIRQAGDPLIEDSLRVIDAVLKVETPHGPCWRRYNHDGYGQGSRWRTLSRFRKRPGMAALDRRARSLRTGGWPRPRDPIFAQWSVSRLAADYCRSRFGMSLTGPTAPVLRKTHGLGNAAAFGACGIREAPAIDARRESL